MFKQMQNTYKYIKVKKIEKTINNKRISHTRDNSQHNFAYGCRMKFPIKTI